MNVEAVVLAAGKGTRMKSDLPKVLHEVNEKPMIYWIIKALERFASEINVVTGHGRNAVEKFVNSKFNNIKFSFQNKQNGTGGAVRSGIPNLCGNTTHVIICAGDTPLLKPETFKELIKYHEDNENDLTVVSTILDDAGHYGRIVRDENNDVKKIVEFLDADKSELLIGEINSGIYLVDKRLLVEAVFKLKNHNSKREYYFTDVIKISKLLHKKVGAFIESDFISLSGVNDRDQLALAEKEMLKRISN